MPRSSPATPFGSTSIRPHVAHHEVPRRIHFEMWPRAASKATVKTQSWQRPPQTAMQPAGNDLQRSGPPKHLPQVFMPRTLGPKTD
eukprot:5548538-Alexandrium_andersonii.AAC.1